MIPRTLSVLLWFFCLATHGAEKGVKVRELADRVRVEIDGQLFTEYFFKDVSRPYFYPIIGPGQAHMTRHYPMKEGVPGEETDHKHHRGLWYGHRSVNGISFWEETGREGKIVHDKFLALESGPESGLIRQKTRWIGTNGNLVCADERTIRIHRRGNKDRMMDFDITLQAPAGDVVFGDDKDGSMATRVAESIRVNKAKAKGQKKAVPGEGHIVLSTGARDSEAWGKRAAWCDYHGPIEGRTLGVAIFDHPNNPRHPTWWHVREYGLFAANPFGQHNFEKLADKEAGAMKIPAGGSVTFRYRFYWHEGDEKAAQVAERYQEYVVKTSTQLLK